MSRDPYAVLGLSRGATPEEVKKAFHRLAHLHHPDKGGDAEKFKEVSAAYADLKDRPAATGMRTHVYYEEAGGVTDDFWDMVKQYRQTRKETQWGTGMADAMKQQQDNLNKQRREYEERERMRRERMAGFYAKTTTANADGGSTYDFGKDFEGIDIVMDFDPITRTYKVSKRKA